MHQNCNYAYVYFFSCQTTLWALVIHPGLPKLRCFLPCNLRIHQYRTKNSSETAPWLRGTHAFHEMKPINILKLFFQLLPISCFENIRVLFLTSRIVKLHLTYKQCTLVLINWVHCSRTRVLIVTPCRKRNILMWKVTFDYEYYMRNVEHIAIITKWVLSKYIVTMAT